MARLFSISSSSFLASSIFYYKRTTSTHTRQLDTHMYDVFACGMMRFSNGNSFIQQNIRRKLSQTHHFSLQLQSSLPSLPKMLCRDENPCHFIWYQQQQRFQPPYGCLVHTQKPSAIYGLASAHQFLDAKLYLLYIHAKRVYVSCRRILCVACFIPKRVNAGISRNIVGCLHRALDHGIPSGHHEAGAASKRSKIRFLFVVGNEI